MKIQRRLTMHFTYQLILYALLFFAVALTLIFLLIQNVTNADMRRNFPYGALEGIIAETPYEAGGIKLSDHWAELIRKHDVWLQVINLKGDVIHATNTEGRSLPHHYSISQLLEIEQRGALGPYSVKCQLDQDTKQKLLYIMGYENKGLQQLKTWFNAYQANGVIPQKHVLELERELIKHNSYLQIVDLEGMAVQMIGSPSSQEAQEPLDILAVQQKPGNYNTSVAVYRDDASSLTWLLHTPREGADLPKQPILDKIVRMMFWLALLMLLLSVAVSVWHGYRYGRPLILFAGWFERMENGQYDEVLTPKDKRRVFRRSGKLRIRYRLYKEVIQAFYQMAERLAFTEKERMRLEKAKQEWMSGISHDLRTPLATIQGYGYMLENAPEQWDREELRLMGTMIREKGDYMLELITDFSLINQLKQDAPPMEADDVRLDELVRQSVLKYVNDPLMNGSQFIYEGDDRPVRISGNTVWLQRLFDNLLSNAVKHNPPGVTVTAAVSTIDGAAYVRIADNGQGMDEEMQQHLFKRYYRGTNTEETSAGSGLGMSIAKMIADAHGAVIEVESALNAGTSITVRFETAHSAGAGNG